MNKQLKTGILLMALVCLSQFTFAQGAKEEPRTINNFDKDWLFIKADEKGAEEIKFDDSKWCKLDVPHDWSIGGDYDKANPSARGGGYLPTGIGWYRKVFKLDQAQAGKQFIIQFDGVMANSDVWINGHHLGKRPYGYISFNYDLSKYLNFGANKINVIAVRADNEVQPASRYYAGAGIYRHVRLIATDPVHIDNWGVYISTPQVTTKKALLKVQTSVVNESTKASQVTVETNIIDPSGKVLGSSQSKLSIAAGKNAALNQDIEVANPKLWDPENPILYRTITKIKAGNAVIDAQVNTFGIRTFKFEAATGFWLNGKNLKLKGVCLHHDAGALGSAVPLKAWERRFKLLKEVGVNAIRVGHNPMAPDFLDLCDKMGFMVMNETFDTWTASKNNGEKGYNLYFKDWWEKDTRDLVLRDRNHPSIIVYSVGNEIRDNLDSPEGFKKYKDLQDLIHQLSPGTPVTMALFRPSSSKVYTNGFAETMDIVGQNYRENELVDFHEAHPDTKALGTENGQTLATWLILRDKPYMAGQFLWTGFNYLGESDWPQVVNNQGLFDQSGSWKTEGLQRQSWWANKPVVHIVRREDNAGRGDWVNNWTPTDFDTYDLAKVEVYSNCDDVELFLNNVSLGSKSKPKNDSPRSWDVSFEKGTIKAIGKNNGKEVASEALKTAGEPYQLILEADQSTISSDWDDVVYIEAKVVDKDGVLCPNASKMITFNASPNTDLIAVSNGNITSHEKYKANNRLTFKGRCQAIIRAKALSGSVELIATSPELKEAKISIKIK
ncbi:MAG: glycoside hydrolase family 2 TIM barrel-domain containing protein [Candidatus Pedobacter colombiensis]|uniref:Glycoside hydrolase family 2 TIM barrel-domain containing protein n=1 Tax=Candidatus Pedobacter colombiensis TaxID=3121371 RepID=A0AAJ6B9G1_9SPHI|nr:sugar-binding domain-containing protein [Pedobacter sp.]WEK20163.1 MAG: glycoside hydrolase family 2 TIM barrel-domain containing protein [Pedobacter sp.]